MNQAQAIVVLAALLTSAGCAADAPQPLVVDSRMQVTVDTYQHGVLHPPVRHQTGRVDPVDQRPARERNFQPQSSLGSGPLLRSGSVLGPTVDLASLRSELEALRAAEPKGLGAYVALARHRKTGLNSAKQAPNVAIDDADLAASDPKSVGDETRPAPRSAQDGDGGYRMNFEDAEVKDVLHAVLGNVLGLTYTIAPNVAGRITISSAAVQSRSELLSTIETVLSLQGLSLTKVGSTYQIAPSAGGSGAVGAAGAESGAGISVVPLQYSSVTSMSKLLSGFATEADGLRIDTARNAIVVRGPAPRRAEIVRAIKSFDSDWMHTQSVSVFELRRSHPEELIPELTRVFNSDANGEGSEVIQFKAIKRLRSIMVISKNPQLVKRAGLWIRRLDHQDTSETDSVFVYRPRYRDAKELVRLVNGLFNADAGGSSTSFQKDQGSQLGQNGQQDQTQRSPGASSTPFGGLSSGGFGQAGGQTGGNGSAGGLGQAGGFASTSSGTPTAGSGLQGNLADPIEANQSSAGGLGGGKLKLTADSGNNTIVAYTDGETYTKVQSVLRQLDLAPLQVAVNVIVAEVQLNDELKYGIQFYLNKKAGSIGLTEAASQILSTKTGFNFLLGGASSPDLVISALDSISKVHILSTPSIVVMENKPATFEVGNQVPVVTQTATSTLSAGAPTLNQVTYVDTGIILKIIPRVGQNGDVAMELDQVISNVVPDATGATDTSLTPTISKRRISSAISVRSGQSVLLAGLINDTRQQQHGQVPFIGAALGDILGNKDNVFSRSELVVFIRPVIIRDGKDASEVASEFKSHLREVNVRNPPVYKP